MRARARTDAGQLTLAIEGGRRLRGQVSTSGFKHSLVTITAAAAAASSRVTVTNCPDIAETRVLVGLLTALGATAVQDGDTLTIQAARLGSQRAGLTDAGHIHGAVYLVPALLSKTGRASVPADGGCQIGDGGTGRRPVGQYASVLERFGAQAHVTPGGTLEVSARSLHGCEIDLLDYVTDRRLHSGPWYSGATKMAILTAAVARGMSTLYHPYPKPDVSDLVTVLRELGCDIAQRPDGALVVAGHGGERLGHDAHHALLPDLIEVLTWICVAAVIGAGPLTVTGGAGMPRAVAALAPELTVLHQMGVRVDPEPTAVTTYPADGLRATDITIASRGIYSDSQPFLALLAAFADGRTQITETVWRNRFGYLPGLRALGVRLRQAGQTLEVSGPCPPHRPGQRVTAPDLRAAAVLLLAALCVPGPTIIDGAHHLGRGYADLPGALRRIGARISTPTGSDR